jgi:hypothetical protein
MRRDGRIRRADAANGGTAAPDAGRATRFSASARSAGGFDCLPCTRHPICCCSRRPKARSWPHNDPVSGECRFDEIGKQRRIELTDGRRAHLFPGDEIVVCFGNRYAPDQFEGIIGDDLGSCDLVAAGGIASREVARNERMLPSTRITPLGLLGDSSGRLLNLRDFAVAAAPDLSHQIRIVLSLGTSMNAGKTFTSTSLVRGLKGAGYRVAAIKATGTGAGNDLWIVRDAGADVILDFTDGGLSSTYLIPMDEIIASTRRLVSHAAQRGCRVAVMEIADGLQHLETAEVVQAVGQWKNCIGSVFAAYDSMGAKCGVDLLRAAGHRVLAISGRLTQSPLMIRETERSTGVRVYTPWELQNGALNPVIMAGAGYLAPLMEDRHHVKILTAPQASSTTLGRLQAGSSINPLSAETAREAQSGICALLKTLAENAMAAEMDLICGPRRKRRCAGRLNRRNGYRIRRWKTSAGLIELRVPRIRGASYRPAFLSRQTLPHEDIGALVSLAALPDAPVDALEHLLQYMGVTQLPSACIAEWSLDLKGRAHLLGLRAPGAASSTHSGTARPNYPNGRPLISEEYLITGGYEAESTEIEPLALLPERPASDQIGVSRNGGLLGQKH